MGQSNRSMHSNEQQSSMLCTLGKSVIDKKYRKNAVARLTVLLVAVSPSPDFSHGV